LTGHDIVGSIRRARASGGAAGVAAVLAALVATAACDARDSKRRPTLLTFAELEHMADDPAAPPLFPDSGVPGGLPLADYVTHDNQGYHLTLRSTITEGYRSGYVTTEMWSDFDEVWAQPVYVPITGFKNGLPDRLKGDDGVWHPIFSLGPKSAFYSPYWQVFYFQVPADTAPRAYTSAKQVIDSGIPLLPGPGSTMAMVPDDIVLPTKPPDSDQVVGGPTKISEGWLDGKVGKYLELGSENFTFDDGTKVVDEIPLFVLVYRHPDGELERLNVPTVAGTGPLYANRKAPVEDLVPYYGAYWRLYTVEIPATARIFAPPSRPDLRAKLPTELYDVAYDPKPELAAGGDRAYLNQYFGWVALNAVGVAPDKGCFEDFNMIDTSEMPIDNRAAGTCQWLESQPIIERAVLPSAIKKTDILVTCPFVSYRDHAVSP
jgi:hypothetical protein